MRHPVEIERIHEQSAVTHLSAGARSQETAQLRVQLATALGGLFLKAVKRRDLALGIEDAQHRRRPRARISSSSRSASQAWNP